VALFEPWAFDPLLLLIRPEDFGRPKASIFWLFPPVFPFLLACSEVGDDCFFFVSEVRSP